MNIKREKIKENLKIEEKRQQCETIKIKIINIL